MEYDFEKLAREIVASRLPELEKAPEAAGEIAKKIITAAVLSTKGRQEARVTVAGVCRGVMSGMLMIDKNLPDAAVKVLQEMHAVSLAVHIEPGDLMTWGMEGIAAVGGLAGVETRQNVATALEESFMGVGPVFSEMCRKAEDGHAKARP